MQVVSTSCPSSATAAFNGYKPPMPMPAHLLDWRVKAGGLVIPVNGLMLAQNSAWFYQHFLQSETGTPGSEIPIDRRVVTVDYDQPEGLQLILRLIGCTNDEGAIQARDKVEGADDELLRQALGPDGLAKTVRAALHFQSYNILDLALSVPLHQLNLNNCWSYWRAAVESGWPLLKSIVQSWLTANFQSAATLPQFERLPSSELLELIQNPELNIDSELDLLNPIQRWLDANAEHAAANRQTSLQLLRCIRQGRLTPTQTLELDRSSLVVVHCGLARAADLFDAISTEDSTALESAKSQTEARIPHEVIFVCGGWEGLQNDPNFGPSDAVQIFNYHERAWTRHSQQAGPVLGCGHAYSGCVLLGHRVFVVGGYVQNRATGYQGPTAGVKAFDLRKGRWEPKANMHHQRNYVSAAALDDFVYAVGGHNGRGRLSSAERYCPTENRWQMIANMLQVRSDAGCAGLQGFLYVCGGFNGHQFFSSVERYDPAVDQWSYATAMQSVRSGVSVCVCDGQLFALGGNNGNSRLATVERYDPEINQWSPMPPMITQRSNFSAALLRGEIYAIGGWSDQTNTTVNVVEKWRPGPASVWEVAPGLPLPASANCCCSVVGLSLLEGLLAAAEIQPQTQAQLPPQILPQLPPQTLPQLPPQTLPQLPPQQQLELQQHPLQEMLPTRHNQLHRNPNDLESSTSSS